MSGKPAHETGARASRSTRAAPCIDEPLDGRSDALLDVRDLVVRYGRRTVVEGVSFQLPRCASAALLGRSGSGKSSILAAILGLARPISGTITVDGHDVLALNRRGRENYLRETVSAVFQHGELIDEIEPMENVAVAALLAGIPRRESFERARALLDELSLQATGILTRDLSGGERQRTAVARALVTEPALVLADEPTGSLDAEFRDVVGDLILSIPSRWGASLLVVTHDEELARRADRTLRLVAGSDAPIHLTDG